MNRGWICPKCYKVWAPHISQCEDCNKPKSKYPPYKPLKYQRRGKSPLVIKWFNQMGPSTL
jgi:hypothetical protein